LTHFGLSSQCLMAPAKWGGDARATRQERSAMMMLPKSSMFSGLPARSWAKLPRAQYLSPPKNRSMRREPAIRDFRNLRKCCCPFLAKGMPSFEQYEGGTLLLDQGVRSRYVIRII